MMVAHPPTDRRTILTTLEFHRGRRHPSDLSSFSLAEVDVDGEISRARGALGGVPPGAR
jgi:hypothetical protein